jgi:hypothetical protein
MTDVLPCHSCEQSELRSARKFLTVSCARILTHGRVKHGRRKEPLPLLLNCCGRRGYA